jgi:GH15 family glucan-1,4-alpha-glucosidase
LPEQLGGPRNWDYRFCWLRDATLTLYALFNSGFLEEAAAWRDWLLRAVAGSPVQMQIMYCIARERRLTECEVRWLRGTKTPHRCGSAMPPPTNSSWTSMARCSMRSTRRAGWD